MNSLSASRRYLVLCGLGLALSALIPARSAAQFCLSQSDCEDGLFCTDDTCFLGLCVRLDRNCADLNISCTSDTQREHQAVCTGCWKVPGARTSTPHGQ
jgi:hypothetical protein